MKILEIIADGRPGGGTTHVLSLMRHLVTHGNDVYFITQQDSYALKRARELEVQARGLDFFFSCLDLRVPWKIGRLVERVQPEVVHVHGSRAGFFFSLASSKYSGPAVYTVHGYHFPHKLPGIRSLALMAERQTVRNVNALVFVSEYDRRLSDRYRLSPVHGRKLVVYNGIEDISLNARRGTDLRCVGFLGRMEYQKDPLLFVDTIRMLVGKGYRAKMIGGGSLESEVRDLLVRYGIDNHVRMLGHLGREDALREIAEVGSILFTSRWEGMPIAVMEAMSMRIPVVAPSVGGIPEIIDDGVSGILVKDRDPRQFAEAVERVTTNPRFRERIVEAAYRDVKERFHHPGTAQRYLEIYYGLVHGRRSGVRVSEGRPAVERAIPIPALSREPNPRPLGDRVSERPARSHLSETKALGHLTRRERL